MTSMMIEVAKDPDTLAMAEQGKALVEEIEALELRGPAAERMGANLLVQLKAKIKAVEERRSFFVKPLNDHVREINNLFKGLMEPLIKGERILKEKLLQRQAEERKRMEEERRAAEKAAREAEEAARAARLLAAREQTVQAEEKAHEATAAAGEARSMVPLALPMPASKKVGGGSITSRKVWRFEVVDLKLVPRSMLKLDEPAVREAIKLGAREVPGLRIYQADELSVATR